MNNQVTILIADDMPNNLEVLKHILQDDYRLIFARTGEEALRQAAEQHPDLILLDVMMPGMDGYTVCQRLKADPRAVKVPVIFVTALADSENEEIGFAAGAVDYITKPVSAPIVRARVAAHLALFNQSRQLEAQVRRRTAALSRSQRDAVFMLGEAGHYNDNDTGVHIWRMAAYARTLAAAVGWNEEACELLELAAPMHDTGKIGIPDAILKKPGKLDPAEWVIMQTHSAIGHEILSMSDAPLFKLAADIAYAHHEKWDGSGYPQGLAKEAIPESARIVAIADVFDALTMKRPYKEAWPIDRAVAAIKEDAGSHFDPNLVDAFEQILPQLLEIKLEWKEKE